MDVVPREIVETNFPKKLEEFSDFCGFSILAVACLVLVDSKLLSFKSMVDEVRKE